MHEIMIGTIAEKAKKNPPKILPRPQKGMSGPERRVLSGSGSSVFDVLGVSPLAVMWEIGFVWYHRVAAKAEILFTGLAFRPTAHAGAQRLKADDLGGPGFLADG